MCGKNSLQIVLPIWARKRRMLEKAAINAMGSQNFVQN
jgi:hypothetical protein